MTQQYALQHQNLTEAQRMNLMQQQYGASIFSEKTSCNPKQLGII